MSFSFEAGKSQEAMITDWINYLKEQNQLFGTVIEENIRLFYGFPLASSNEKQIIREHITAKILDVISKGAEKHE
jgi:hypothetical protein